MVLRVITYNIHGARPIQGTPDLPAIAEVVRGLDPHVAGLQEVHCRLPPPGVWQDQPGMLSQLLGMHGTFLPSFGFAASGYGNLLLSRQGPVSAVRCLLPSGKEQRAFVDARVPVDGLLVRVGLTHLGLVPEERVEQVRAIHMALQDDPQPTLLLGDWNAPPDAPELAPLLAAGFRHAAPPGTFTFPSNAPDRRIDHILVSPHWRVERCWTVPSAASDHLPLAAELSYTG